MEVDITWEPRGVCRTFRGDVTGRDVLESFVLINSDQRYDDVRYNILDFTHVGQWQTNEEELRVLGAHNVGPGIYNPHVRVLVVTADPQLETTARRYASLGLSPYPHEFFASLEQARAWIAQNLPTRA